MRNDGGEGEPTGRCRPSRTTAAPSSRSRCGSRSTSPATFLGGLAGASSTLAAGAELTGRRTLARSAKTASTAAASLSLVALVHDLGRPSRFPYMLRVFKPTSPMSVGSWLLSAFVPFSAAATVAAWTGRFGAAGRVATLAAAAVGSAVASYTGVLLPTPPSPRGTRGTGRCRSSSSARRRPPQGVLVFWLLRSASRVRLAERPLAAPSSSWWRPRGCAGA